MTNGTTIRGDFNSERDILRHETEPWWRWVRNGSSWFGPRPTAVRG